MEPRLHQPKYPDDKKYMTGYNHGMKNSNYITPFTNEELHDVAYGLSALIRDNEEKINTMKDGYFIKGIEDRNIYLKKLREKVRALYGTGEDSVDG